MRKLLKYSILVVLFTIYIYTIVFRILPISAKYFLEGIGLLLSLRYLLSSGYRVKKSIRWIFQFAIIVALWDVIVNVINGTYVFVLIKSLITPIASIFGAQFLYECSKNELKTHHDFLFIVIMTVFIESLITVAMRFIPPVFSFFDSIQITMSVGEGDASIDDITSYYRLVGIGSGLFFAALQPIAIALLSCVYEIHSEKDLTRRLFFYFSFASIAVIGLFVVRTSFALTGLSLLLLFYYMTKERLSRSIGAITVFSFAFVLLFFFVTTYFDEGIISWAFDSFTGKNVGTQDNSANQVMEWWKNAHFEIKTFLIGDGLYTNPNGVGYYMGTDIGFFRRIYYGGIIGLLLYLYYHYKIAYFTYKSIGTRDIKYMMLFLVLSYMVILAKGDANMLSLFVLYLVFFERGIFYRVKERYPQNINN